MHAATKTTKIARKYGVSGGTIFFGKGIANSHLLDVFAVNENRREIVFMEADDVVTEKAIRGISREMAFDKPHHGIAFSISLSAFFSDRDTYTKNSDDQEVKESMYKIIFVVVPRGKGEDVTEAAYHAGAKGGTIVNARGVGSGEAHKTLFMDIEPENEVVFIIAKTEAKDGIVQSIRDYLKIGEHGNGVLFVMDINEVFGLHEE